MQEFDAACRARTTGRVLVSDALGKDSAGLRSVDVK